MRTLTDEQNDICESILHWFYFERYHDDVPNYKTIGGYAGTGKTYLISLLSKIFKKDDDRFKIAFVAFTGKASSSLKTNLEIEDCYNDNSDYCGTIHSLIYKPETRYDAKQKRMVITGWTQKQSEEVVYDLIIIDEASMISSKIWNDLRKYDIPIIAVGDHGQLPPIGDKFNLMNGSNLNYKLTQIQRQTSESGIISLSTFIRQNGYIPHGKYSKSVFKVNWNTELCQKVFNSIDFLNDDVICICGFNNTRVHINNLIRKKLKYKKQIPYPSERVVCLKNNSTKGVFNGQLGTVSWMMPKNKEKCEMTIMMDGMGEFYDGVVNLNCFGKKDYSEMYEPVIVKKKKVYPSGDFFDFGYCLSVHKSQGSEFNKVILFEEKSQYWDDEYYKRWLYTGVTRAKNSLMIVSGY